MIYCLVLHFYKLRRFSSKSRFPTSPNNNQKIWPGWMYIPTWEQFLALSPWGPTRWDRDPWVPTVPTTPCSPISGLWHSFMLPVCGFLETSELVNSYPNNSDRITSVLCQWFISVFTRAYGRLPLSSFIYFIHCFSELQLDQKCIRDTKREKPN